MSKLETYSGEEGRTKLVRTLQLSHLVHDMKEIAEDLADRVELLETKAGDVLVEAGEFDDDLHLILTGTVGIFASGNKVAQIGTGGHVGELALIDPRANRCATAVALVDTVCARISREQFVECGNRHPHLWRRISKVLGDRLKIQNRFVRMANTRPRVLLAATTGELGATLEPKLRSEDTILKPFLIEAEPILADTGGIFASESFADTIDNLDFGIIARSQGDLSPASLQTRDALLYLCGICVGKVGASRTIIVEPDDEEAGTLTALFGVPALTYSGDSPVTSQLDAFAESLQEQFGKLGPK